MKSADNIRELIKGLCVRPDADVDRKIHAGISQALEEWEQTKRTPCEHKIRRVIMRTKIGKLAAAAVIAIAVMAGLHYYAGPIGVTSVAWADVVEQISNHTKYKCRQRVVTETGPEVPAMQVYHLNLSQRRQEVEDGSIHIIDMRRNDAITVELRPAEMKGIVTKLIGFGPRSDPDIIEMVKRFEQESTEKLGTKKQNGRILQGFRHQPNKYNEFTVWVDPKTKLPVEIEIKHLNRGQTLFLDEFEFDFELDPSAFSTEVPDGYEVEFLTLDYRPVEPKKVTPQDIQTGLNHTAYAVEKLPWMENIISIETIDPLGTRAIVYITGIQSNDGNMIIIVQGNLYDGARMVWIPEQQITLETPSGTKLYTHPNGSIYAQLFLESFAKANPEFFDIKNLSEERFTRMIVLPDGTIMGLCANKQMSNERLQELVGSLKEINPN